MSGEAGIAGDCEEERACQAVVIEGDGGRADVGVQDLQECSD